MNLLIIELTLLLSYCDGFIVPQEVSSLLSAVYSNIPPITKGTDSRFGIGFRLGEHADFQTIIELGPQKFTKSLRKGANESDTSKRMVNLSKYNKVNKPTYEKSNQWIQNWANEMESKTTNHIAKKSQKAKNDSFKLLLFGPKDQYSIPMASIIINPSALKPLQPVHSKFNEQSNETADQAIGTLPSYLMEAHVLAATNFKRQQQIKSD